VHGKVVSLASGFGPRNLLYNVTESIVLNWLQNLNLVFNKMKGVLVFCALLYIILLQNVHSIDHNQQSPTPVVKFERTTYTFEEGTHVNITLTSTNVAGNFSHFIVEVYAKDITAKNGEDYFLEPVNITFSTNSEFLDFRIPKDSILEKSETFQLQIVIPPVWAERGVTASPINNVTTVTIMNKDTAVINFEHTAYTVKEGSGVKLRVSLTSSMPSSFEYKVQLQSIPNNALGDFRPLNGITVKFFEGSQTAPFDVEIIDNNEYKGPRTFSIQFNILGVGTEKGNNSSTLVTILEDDDLLLRFEKNEYSVEPGQQEMEIKLLANIAVYGTVHVKILFKHSSTTLMRHQLSFSSGQTAVQTTVNITKVLAAAQDGGGFQMQLEILESPPLVDLGSPSQVTVTIHREVATIQFADQSYHVVEGDRVNLTVMSNTTFPVPAEFTLIQTPSGDTANRSVDYVLGTVKVFSITSRLTTVSIVTLGDSSCEGNETFTVTISPEDQRLVVGGISLATVVIVDSSPQCNLPKDSDNTSCPSIQDPWGYQWNVTLANTTATQSCSLPNTTAKGSVSRVCEANGVWKRTDVRDCRSTIFSDIEDDLADLFKPEIKFRGFRPPKFTLPTPNEIYKTVREIAERLIDASKDRNAILRSLFPRELDIMDDFVSTIIKAADDFHIFSIRGTEEVADQTTAVISNVLNIENSLGWSAVADIEEGKSITLPQKLLENIEEVSLLFADSSFGGDGEVFTRDNIGINPLKMSASNDSLVVTGDAFNDTQWSNVTVFRVEIPTGVISGEDVPVSVVIAKNIDKYLFAGNSSSSQSLGTLLMSVNIDSTSRRVSNLTAPISMTFPITQIQEKEATENESCVFWQIGSGWSTTGLTTRKLSNGSVVCTSQHLTSFGVLVDVHGITSTVDPVQQKVLSITTYIGCGVSLICLVLTILFYLSLGKEIFNKVNNFVILNLAIALACGLFVFCVGIETAKVIEGLCVFVTALLHYFFLATFCWTLCEAVLLYNMLVKVFDAHKQGWLYFYAALGWVTPIPIVVFTLGLSLGLGYDYFIRDNRTNIIVSCWLPTQNGLIWSFVVPMIVIIIINTVLLAVVIRSLCKSNMGKRSIEVPDDDEKISRQNAKLALKAIIILLPLLGLTWIIGLFAADPTFSIIFAYIFVALNVLQGLFIFLFHVVRHDRVWSKLKLCCTKAKAKSSFIRESSTATTKAKNGTTKSNGTKSSSRAPQSSLNQDNDSIKDVNMKSSSL
jgi:hypothetical protein